jgi:hypothetical protein
MELHESWDVNRPVVRRYAMNEWKVRWEIRIVARNDERDASSTVLSRLERARARQLKPVNCKRVERDVSTVEGGIELGAVLNPEETNGVTKTKVVRQLLERSDGRPVSDDVEVD